MLSERSPLPSSPWAQIDSSSRRRPHLSPSNLLWILPLGTPSVAHKILLPHLNTDPRKHPDGSLDKNGVKSSFILHTNSPLFGFHAKGCPLPHREENGEPARTTGIDCPDGSLTLWQQVWRECKPLIQGIPHQSTQPSPLFSLFPLTNAKSWKIMCSGNLMESLLSVVWRLKIDRNTTKTTLQLVQKLDKLDIPHLAPSFWQWHRAEREKFVCWRWTMLPFFQWPPDDYTPLKTSFIQPHPDTFNGYLHFKTPLDIYSDIFPTR